MLIIITAYLLALIPPLSLCALYNSSDYSIASGFAPMNQTRTSNETATTDANFTVDTDKSVYVAGESVTVDGKVDNVIQGESVRLDFYDPAGKPIGMIYKFTEPDEDGFFSFSGIYAPSIPDDAKPGEYTFLATYNKESIETKTTVK